MISFRVGSYEYEVGASSFLYSFFSTVAYRLEDGNWGSKYPIIMNELYQGRLSYENVTIAKTELRNIKENLLNFSPDKVIWDIEDLSKQPPWGNNISSHITSLSNYFVTSNGMDFIEIFNNVLDKSIELKKDVYIQ